MLIIPKTFHFSDFEKYLKESKSEPRLRLPSKLKHTGLWGNEAALIQLLITWARAHPKPEIKTYINDEDQEGRKAQLTDLGHRLFGISALYLAHSVVTGQDTEIPKNEYAKYCNHVLKSMNECDIHSSESVNKTYPRTLDKVAAQFVCLHGSQYEFLKSLYHQPSRKELLDRGEFGALLHSALKNKPAFSKYISQSYSSNEALANLLYELFKNTNDHSYEMLDGKTSYPKNVRSIIIKSHSGWVGGQSPTRMQTQNDRFNKYLNYCADLFPQNNAKNRHFLEISIVDGGTGFAQRFTKKPIDAIPIQEEIRITAACFREGVTSKGTASRGDGLDLVWQYLCNLNGFIRLRTGRICLYQVFHDKKASDQRSFSNWTDDELTHAEGTMITIIIPCIL